MNCFTFTGFNISDLSTYLCIVTARKRNLRRLCFYTCLSTVGGGVSRHKGEVGGKCLGS